MPDIDPLDAQTIERDAFDNLIGENFAALLFDTAPKKVRSRIVKALDHYNKALKLSGTDDEMGAIRLIAGEEELVVAIFEWIKLNETLFPEHGDFVRKFKNHAVKLAFYPVLAQFRFLGGDMLTDGFVIPGLEHVSWGLRPVIEGNRFRLAILSPEGEELLRHDPLHHDISRGEQSGMDVVPHIVGELESILAGQHGQTIKQFLNVRTDYRNLLLYAQDGGHYVMGETLEELFEQFNVSYRDLLWVLLALIGGRPISKKWGVASQFIAVYRAVLTKAGVIRSDGSVSMTDGA